MNKDTKDALMVLRILKQVKTTGKGLKYSQYSVLLREGVIKIASDKSKKKNKKLFLLTAKGKKLLREGTHFFNSFGVTV
jgi:predicted transcriptional regulator